MRQNFIVLRHLSACRLKAKPSELWGFVANNIKRLGNKQKRPPAGETSMSDALFSGCFGVRRRQNPRASEG